MPDATEEEIRAEVRRVIDIAAPGGSAMVFATTIKNDIVPIIIDEAETYARAIGKAGQYIGK